MCICILFILCIWPAFCHAIIKRILIDWLTTTTTLTMTITTTFGFSLNSLSFNHSMSGRSLVELKRRTLGFLKQGFYRSDRFSVSQPTSSKHWRDHLCMNEHELLINKRNDNSYQLTCYRKFLVCCQRLFSSERQIIPPMSCQVHLHRECQYVK